MKLRSLCLFLFVTTFTLLAALPDDVQKRLDDGYRLEGTALTSSANIFGTKDIIPSPNALEAHSLYYNQSGFYQMEQNWDAARIRQFEFTVKSDKPGYFRFAGNLLKDGAKKHFSCTTFSVIPDGVYRTFVVTPPNDIVWEGILTNWELAWQGPADATIGLKMLDASNILNAIPDACHLQPGSSTEIPCLRPRANCTIHWQGEDACPGIVLHFLDHKLKEIEDSTIVLPAGAKEISFTTPEALILATVTQEADANGYPVLEQTKYSPMFEPQGRWRGNWLWFQKEEGPNYYNAWFEKDIVLDADPDYASIAFLADDTAYIYVNQQFCGKNEVWQVPVRSNITKSLHAGLNKIQIRVYNGEQAAGLAADIYIHANGKDIYLDTDDTWRCETKRNQPHSFPEVVEEPVTVLGNPHTTAPWKAGISYRYAGPRGELAMIGKGDGTLQVKVLSLPPCPVDSLRFLFTSPDGSVKSTQLPISPSSSQWNVGDTITISYKLPPLDAGDYQVTLDDDYVGLAGDPVIAEIHQEAKPAPEIQQARFLNNGRPFIMLGDRKITPVFWHAIATIRKERFHEFPLAERCGTDNFRLCADFQDFWTGENQYDFSKFDRAVELMYAAQPDAVFCVHINSQMPAWWLDANPDEVCTFQDGSRTGADQYKQSLASRKWVNDAAVPIRALIDHMRSQPYADHVWGLSVAESNNGEWFWDNTDSKRQLSWGGYNKTDLEFFRDCVKEKYGTDEALAAAWHRPGMTFDQIDTLPDWHLVQQGTLGRLKDPVQDQMLMDWLESRNIALGNAICQFGKIVKDATDGKWLFGAYYGYWNELACNAYRGLTLTGHNGLWKTIQSPYVDFFSAPSRYNYRKSGMPDGIMQPWSSFLFHNKMIYNEMDYRTAYNRMPEPEDMRYYVGQPTTALESVGHWNRAFGMNATTGIAGYIFDLIGGELYEQALDDVLREQARVYESLPPVAGTTPCEVAVVGNIDSAYYTPGASTKDVFVNAMDGLFLELSRLGIPYHSLMTADLLDHTVTIPSHKLYIMLPTLVLTVEERTALMARFQAEAASVVWLYAAAPFYPGQSASAEANADFLGIQTRLVKEEYQPAMTTIPEYGEIFCKNLNPSAPWFLPVKGFDEIVGEDANAEPLMVRKAIDNSNHYYTCLMNLPAELYAEILPRAGVHQYVADLKDQVWIGNDLLFLYAVSDGPKRLTLPKGYQAEAIIGPFEGPLPQNGTFNAKAGLTYGFHIAPAP